MVSQQRIQQESQWLEEEIEECHYGMVYYIPRMEETIITKEDQIEAIKRTHSWKAPGLDKIHNYWFKYYTAIHGKLTELCNETIEEPNKLPPFFT